MPKPWFLRALSGLALCIATLTCAQTVAPAAAVPFAALAFLEGNWSATSTGQGAAASGSYRFTRELGGHVLARHARTAECKGGATLDCEHGDLLYVYAEGPGQALRAIYFDSEGHVLHYTVSTPQPDTVEFVSEAAEPGPRFRLMYALAGGVMKGRFQMQAPGQTAWRSYLEWSGSRQ
jgi:hypothetical protein